MDDSKTPKDAKIHINVPLSPTASRIWCKTEYKGMKRKVLVDAALRGFDGLNRKRKADLIQAAIKDSHLAV